MHSSFDPVGTLIAGGLLVFIFRLASKRHLRRWLRIMLFTLGLMMLLAILWNVAVSVRV